MKSHQLSLAAAISSYIMWGLLAVFWHQLSGVPSSVVVAHRMVWSALSLAILFIAVPRFARSIAVDASQALRYGASAVLLAVNWGTYIWAIANHRLLAASLGYFLAPLMYIAVGFYLKEQISAGKKISCALCAAGFAVLLAYADLTTVLVALLLAGSMTAYGSIRRRGKLTQLQGQFFESLVVAPFAAAFLSYHSAAGQPWFGNSWHESLLLALAGPVTVLPLVLFGFAVKNLPMSTIGFLQYITPTMQFLLAFFAYGERLDHSRLAAFALIWTALLVVSVEDRVRKLRRVAMPA